MNKSIPIAIVLAFALGGASFYGGMKYAQSNHSHDLSSAGFQNLRNLSPQERQQRLQQLGISASATERFGQRNEAGLISGEIISKDDKSITVNLVNGGSKIIFYSGATEVSKSVTGSTSDFEVGRRVSASGIANSDGSINAQSIQLR